jgi:monomeric isocitrate dehydrogenase
MRSDIIVQDFMPIRIRRSDNKYQEAQLTDAKWVISESGWSIPMNNTVGEFK